MKSKEYDSALSESRTKKIPRIEVQPNAKHASESTTQMPDTKEQMHSYGLRSRTYTNVKGQPLDTSSDSKSARAAQQSAQTPLEKTALTKEQMYSYGLRSRTYTNVKGQPLDTSSDSKSARAAQQSAQTPLEKTALTKEQPQEQDLKGQLREQERREQQLKEQALFDKSLPQGTGINNKFKKNTKERMHEDLHKIFLAPMSKNVLVDIVINIDQEGDNTIVVVGRPQGLHAYKQMRHVIPYSFVLNAIKSIITTKEKVAWQDYLDNIINAMGSLIRHKQGICLTNDLFEKFKNNCKEGYNQVNHNHFLLNSKKQDGSCETYHMIYSIESVELFKKNQHFTKQQVAKAEDDFNIKFEKYVKHAVRQYTKLNIEQNDEFAMIAFLEAITRMILTVSNQDKNSAFPIEGNSICREVHLYTNVQDALNATKDYLVYSQAQIIDLIEKDGIEQYQKRIRIINNEGARVLKVSNVLMQLNILINDDLLSEAYETRQDKTYFKVKDISKEAYKKSLYDKYNSLCSDKKYNTFFTLYNTKYTQSLTEKNIQDILHYHVAMHLYSIFDFKPLEQKVLVPITIPTYLIEQQGKNNSVIEVYPSSSGKKTSLYIIEEGNAYRNIQCNAAEDYNETIRFRSQLNDKDIVKILQDKIVTYINVALLPFTGLYEKNVKSLITQAFYDLLKEDYRLTNVNLSDLKYTSNIDDASLDTSGQSSMLNFEQLYE